ncbi:MAG: hypothetical protein IJT26_08095 [Bacteroidales bacterium]|nr:hypothetical protein [Bacteroidales bacterium]
MKQHKKSIREKSIADPINTESIEHYILRPNESFGIFKFGDKISNYLNLKHTIEDIDGYFEDYIFYELGIRIWLAEDSKEKIIESVVSSSFCIINNYNIIGMSYGQFVKLYDFICEGEDTIYLNERNRHLHHVYEFPSIGLQLWTWRNRIIEIVAYKASLDD